MKNINKETIRSYLQKLHQRGESPSLILKKLTVVDKFLTWAYQKNLIEEDVFKQIKEEIDNIKSKVTLRFGGQKSKVEGEKLKRENILLSESPKFVPEISDFEKAAYAGEKKTEGIFGEISIKFHLQAYKIKSFLFGWLKSLPLLSKKTASKETEEKEKKTTSGFDFSNLGIHHYIGFLFLLVFLGFLGAGLYNKFFLKVERSLTYPSSLTRGGRVLSFQGRLTDSLGNPITTATNVQFKLYNVLTGGTPLYTAGPCSITPDQDGIFSTLIGQSCGSEIPNSVFTENPNIYLGVTVGADSEMTPRQPIANVGYAINAETLQGFPPGEGTNNIPFINQDGNLLIAVASPGIRSTFTSADFTLSSAKAAVIQSAGTGDVILQATESGALRFRTGGNNDTYTRIIVDNTGNVGIGTTSPSYGLHVALGGGGISAQFAGRVIGADAVNSNEFVTLSQLQGGTGSLWLDGGDYLYPNTNFASNVMVSSGRLGVGLTSTPFKFEVTGNDAGKALASFNYTGTDQNILVASQSGTLKFAVGYNGNLISAAGSKWLPSSDSTTALNIANAAGTSFVTFDTTNQRVGIGTTGPTATLSLQSNQGSQLDFYWPATSGQIVQNYYLYNGSFQKQLFGSFGMERTGGASGKGYGSFVFNLTSGTGTLYERLRLYGGTDTSGGGYLQYYDQTPTYGTTRLILRAGAGQGSTNLTEWKNNANQTLASLSPAGDFNQSGLFSNPYGGLGRYENLLTYSEEFDNAAWVKNRAAVTANSTTAPNNTNTADTVTFQNGDCAGNNYIYQSTSTAAGSGTFTGSVYIKGTGSSFTFRLKISNDSGTEQYATSDYTLNSSTTSWQRISVTKTFSSAEGNVRLVITTAPLACGNFTAYIWGAQVEQQSTPGVYVNSGANTVTAGNGLVADGSLFFSNVATDITTGTNEDLTITPGGTGNVILTSGNVGIGTTSPTSLLSVGSSSQFQVNSSGNIVSIGGVGHSIDNNSGNLRLSSNSSTIELNDNVTFAGTTTLNGQTYTWPSSQTSGYVLSTNGSGTLSWVDAAGAAAGSIYWTQNAGLLYPKNSTVDLAIGGNATSSAKFAFTNINSGTPTLVFNQASNFDLVNSTVNALNIEGGLLSFDTSNSRVGIGTTSPGAELDVAGNILVNNGGSIDTRSAGTLTIGGTTQTGLTLGRSGAATTISGSTVNISNLTTNGVVYTSGGNGTLNSEALLAITRGGTNSSATPTAGAIAYGTGTAYAFNTVGTTGQPLLSGGTGAPTFGTLGLVYGGTNADLSGVSTGGLIYKGTSALAGTGALSGILQGNGSSAPTAITGTANYLPKWSSTAPYLTSTSLIYDDGTNVGIGTNSPNQKLSVAGTLGILEGGTSPQYYTIFQGGDQTADITYTLPTSIVANGFLTTDASGVLSWATDVSATSLKWNALTDPDGNLTLNHGTYTTTFNTSSTTGNFFTINANSLTSGKGLYLSSTATSLTGNLAEFVLSGSNTSNTGNVVRIAQEGTSSASVPLMITNLGTGLSFRVNDETGDNDTTPFVIDSAGNVGVGTTGPKGKLDVTGNLTITGGYGVANSSDVRYPSFGGGLSSSNAGSLTFGDNSGWRFNIGTQVASVFTPRVTFVDTGNVGIGTTGPGGKLHVVGASGVGRSVMIDDREIKFRGDSVGHFSIYGPDTGKSYLTIQNTSAGSGPGTVGPDLLTITTGGNVGIGTTSPAGMLHVAATSPFVITSAGQVGIGTTGPGEKLEVVGNILATNLKNYYLTRTLPTSVNDYVEIGYFTLNASGFNLDVTVTVSNSGFSVAKRYIIPVQYSGGTSGTWYTALPISDSGVYSGNDFSLEVMWNTSNTFNLRLRRTAGSTAGTALVHIEQRGGSGTTFTAQTGTGTMTAPSALWETTVLTQQSGNVGIGTTSPGTKLEINDGNNTYIQFNPIATSHSVPFFKLSYASNNNLSFYFNDSGATNNWGRGTVFNSSVGGRGFTFGYPSNADFRLAGSSSTDAVRFLVDGSGNVGIGTTSPAGMLHVAATSPFVITSAGQVGIGTTSPNQKLSVAGTLGILEGGTSPIYYTIFQGGDQTADITYTLPTSIVANGFLTTDASGVLSWTTNISATSLKWNALNDPDGNLTLNHGTYTTTFNTSSTTGTFFTINANSLTSGKGLYLSSTATSLTGNLAEFVLSGSNTSNTGNVVRIAQEGTSSASVPLMITNLGTGLSFRVNDETGDNDSTPFVIDSAGNVGVGTTSPSYLLTLQGTNSVATVGSELITNNDDRTFDTDTGNWSGTNWTISGGVASHTAGAYYFEYSPLTPTSGATYQIKATINTTTAGAIYAQIGGVAGVSVGQSTGTLTQHTWVITTTGTGKLRFVPDSTWVGTIDDVTVKQITPSNAILTINNSDGTLGLQARSGGSSYYNTFVGVGTGQAAYNTTGSEGKYNSALGYQALYSNTTGYYNSAVGLQALYSNTTGYQNSAVGLQALYSNTTGFQNSAVGLQALYSNTTGFQNSAMGYGALYYNTTGYRNSAMGYGALYYNTTGYNNSAMGYQALYSNTTGYNNSAMGYQALYYNTTGYQNSAVGYRALFSNTTGYYNSAMGSRALYYNTTGYNNSAMGYGALYYNTTGYNNSAMGYGALYYNTTGLRNSALGTSADFYAPSAISTATAVSGSGLSVGTYYYRVSFVLDGVETALGERKSVTTTSSNQQVNLSGIPTYSGPKNCTARKIYRTVVGQETNYYLVTTINDNTTTTYSDTKPDVTESGDTTNQLSNWVLNNVDGNQSNNGVLYWNLTNSGTTRTVDIYKDAAKTQKVASGSRSGDGSITLSPQSGYSVSGSVTVTYTADDTDSGNTLDLGAFPPDNSNSIMLGYGAKAFASNQMVIGTDDYYINDIYLGEGVYATSPHDVTINATGGQGTDNTGASLILAGGKGTGAGAGGSIIFKTAPAGASGTSANSLSEVMRITSTGNVGIGTTSPNQKLSVAGTLGILEGGTSPTYYTIFQGGDQSGNITYTLPTTQGSANSSLQNDGSGNLSWFNPSGGTGIFGYWQRTAGSLAPTNITDSLNLGAIATSSALVHLAGTPGEKSFINAGNVGVGTTNPQALLEVVGDIQAGRFIDRDNAAYGIDPAGNTLINSSSIYTAYGAILASVSGNVGIGSTSPTAKLTINGTTEQLRLSYDASNYQSFTVNSTGAMTIAQNGGAATLALTNGNVGIGTTAPGAKLDVAGTGVISIRTPYLDIHADNAASTDRNYIRGLADHLVIQAGNRGSGTLYLNWNDGLGSGPVRVAETLFVTGGNVGIGSTSPTAKLTINGTTEQLRLSYDASNYQSFTVNSTGAMTIAQNGGAATLALTNGNVGIGTTAPEAKLHVQQGNILLKANEDDAGDIIFRNSAGTQKARIWSDPNAGVNKLHLSSADNTPDISIDANGNVGIGTTSPTAKLDVIGSATVSGTLTAGIMNQVNAGNCDASAEGRIFYDKAARIYKACTYNSANSSYDWRPLGGLSDQHHQAISTNNVVNNQIVRKGWNYANGTTTSISKSITYGITFDDIPIVTAVRAGRYSGSSPPTSLSQCSAGVYYIEKGQQLSSISSTGFTITFGSGSGNYLSTDYICITWVAIGTYSAGYGADLAEYYLTYDSSLDAADIVAIDPKNDIAVVKADPKNNPAVIGVVSTQAGIILGSQDGTTAGVKTSITGEEVKKGAKTVPIALAGRVPVKVSLENGPIYRGDPLTFSSTLAGVAVKATTPGPIIGRALENFDGKHSIVDSLNKNKINKDKTLDKSTFDELNKGIGKIMVFVQNYYYDTQKPILTSTGDLNITSVNPKNEKNINAYNTKLDFSTQISKLKAKNYELKLKTGEFIEIIGAFAEIAAAKIKTGLLETENAVVNNVLAAKNIAAENINLTTKNLTIAGKTIEQFIDERIERFFNLRLISFNSQKIISPVVETTNLKATSKASLNIIATNEIKPQEKDLVINLNNNVGVGSSNPNNTGENSSPLPNFSGDKGPLARLVIKGLEGKTAVTIDASGNASFSGTLTAQQISTNIASASALISTNLKTENATISGALSTNTLNATEASISGKIIAKEVEAENINEIQRLLAEIKNQPLPDLNNQTNLSNTVDFGRNVINHVSTIDLTVTGQSNLYNVSVSNSLLVGQTFIENNSIIALASELKLSALEKINLFDGAVTIAKDGTITTKGTLIAQGGIKTSTITPLEKEVSVLGNLSILGDLSLPKATNSAVIAAPDNFNKNGIFAPAIEASASAAGTGIIPKTSQEVVIYSSFAKPNSLIYLTPKTTQPISLSVFEKKDGFFRVIRDQLLNQDVTFDWLIIN